ncbi:hypothetical protein BBI01_07205 [Chryseobacterium artocarpi]|uniref:Uncharacterized protein n=1 Tax=Chryseobacterium artocarpi TaxID=1414727 RepID=A0A1B8ZK84_9FLAO|nr:hypothetical protein [Chryseobacterium artocarpi]OCA71937.1 hypothetical protein BBI01_07205 [Chryseobacterium artocarpi]
MENSEQQKKIINLGKLFVKELELEPGVDTLSRWMAHYLAEKISYAEESIGMDKDKAEKECFEIILSLWKNRHTLPRGRRPFYNFESIIDTLNQLSPDNEEPYFYTAMQRDETTEFATEHFDYKSVEDWLNIVKEIDKTARIWIEYSLKRAASKAIDKDIGEWVENSTELDDRADVTIITTILDNQFLLYDENKEDLVKNSEIKRLQKRIAELKKYLELNKILLVNYENDLNNIL